MRFFILGFSIFLLLSSCEYFLLKKKISDESASSANNTDEKKKYTGTRESHDENGKISSSVEYVEGVRHGMAREYYKDGTLKLEMVYEHGKKQGRVVSYDEKGRLARESFYIDDDLDGVRKIYSNGKIRAEIPYKQGMPGKGLVEYLVSGKLKTKYPTISITPVDDRSQTGFFHLQIEFTEVDPKDEFYQGDLADGKYVHEKLERINTRKGHGKISLYVPPGNFIMQELHIVGVHYTLMGNPYVITKIYNLSVE